MARPPGGPRLPRRKPSPGRAMLKCGVGHWPRADVIGRFRDVSSLPCGPFNDGGVPPCKPMTNGTLAGQIGNAKETGFRL